MMSMRVMTAQIRKITGQAKDTKTNQWSSSSSCSGVVASSPAKMSLEKVKPNRMYIKAPMMIVNNCSMLIFQIIIG